MFLMVQKVLGGITLPQGHHYAHQSSHYSGSCANVLGNRVLQFNKRLPNIADSILKKKNLKQTECIKLDLWHFSLFFHKNNC